MGKKRAKSLGKAELPRSLTEFLVANHDQLSVALLLNYIEELEKLNSELYANWADIKQQFYAIDQRLEEAELALERASGTRILKPLTQKEIAQRRLDKLIDQPARSRKSPYGGRSKGSRRIP